MARLTPVLAAFLLTSAALAGPSASSPDGRLIAKADGKAITVSTGQPPKILMKMLGHTDDITAITYGPDGKTLVSADKGGGVRVFDSATGKEVIRIAGPKGVTGVSVTGDGKTLVLTVGKETKKYSLATGAEVK